MEDIKVISLEEIEAHWRNTPLIKRLWRRLRWRVCAVADLPHHTRRIRWFIQRGRRGYADCDWWGMHTYLIGIILPMLEQLKINNMSYPGYGRASTPEKWKNLLDEMIECFEIAKRVDDCEYKDYNDIHADIKLFEKKMRVFTRWFFHLWD